MGRSPSFTFQVIFLMFGNVEEMVTSPFILVLYVNFIRASVGIRCYCLSNQIKVPICLLHTTVYSISTVNRTNYKS